MRLEGKHVAVIFDGSTVLHPMEATLIRCVEEYKIVTLVIGLKRVPKSVSAPELCMIILEHLGRVGVTKAQVVAMNADRAATNGAAIRFFVGSEELRLPTGYCLSFSFFC